MAGAAVDLVNDDTLGLSLAQTSEHLGEDGAPTLCRGLALFKPLGDSETVALGVTGDGVLLLVERYALITLFLGRDARVSKV